METQVIKFDKAEARALWRKYCEHKHYSAPIDEEIARIYQTIAQGRTVIRAFASVVAAGLHINGVYHGLPKLAIARADMESVDWRPTRNTASFRTGDGRSNAARSHHLDFRWPGLSSNSQWGSAKLPAIPLHLRPKRGLPNYHVLWEAEWQRQPPGDPLLLRRIGLADAWLVVAAWGLTEVERAALSTRMNG